MLFLLTTSLQQPAPTRDAVFRWFDTLGFDVVRTGQFVRVDGQQNGKSLPPVFGFLVSRDKRGFTVLTGHLELIRRQFSPTAPTPTRFAYKAADLGSWIPGELAIPNQILFGLGIQHPDTAECVVLARACASRGMQAESDLCWEEAKNNPFSQVQAKDMWDLLRKQFGSELYDGVLLDFRDRSVSRASLLSRLERISRDYPDFPNVEDALDVEASLRAMAQKDKYHIPIHGRLAALPVDKRVAELIYRLKDQEAHPFMVPGPPRIFMIGGAKGKGPAQDLADIGVPAVPQLLNALRDRRFIWGFSELGVIERAPVPPMTVGGAVLQILERIAGRSFYSSQEGSAESKIQDWWKTVQEQGECAALCEEVAAGGWDSPTSAERLVRIYPQSALDAIRQGVDRSSLQYVPSSLVSWSGAIHSKEALQFAADQMSGGNTLSVRIAAAFIFARTDPNQAVDAMIGEWQRLGEKEPNSEDSTRLLVNFLFLARTSPSVEAVIDRFNSLSYRQKLTVFSEVSALAVNRRYVRFRSVSSGERKRVESRFEAFLTTLLTAPEPSDEKSLPNQAEPPTKIAGRAAWALHVVWPDRFAYRPQT